MGLTAKANLPPFTLPETGGFFIANPPNPRNGLPMVITPQNAREFAAKSAAARKRYALERENPVVQQSLIAADLQSRATELNDLLASLKADLRAAKDPQDKLRLCQAIDRLEQSWARYAGVPTPPKATSRRRQVSSTVEPIG